MLTSRFGLTSFNQASDSSLSMLGKLIRTTNRVKSPRQPPPSRIHRRLLSNNNSSKPDSDIQECAKSLNWMSTQVTLRGETLASDWASQLSPAARSEISSVVAQASTAASSTELPEPSPRDLRLVALQQAIPFVGFGIMDNAILIVAGDAIDTSLGVVLGISTMCAAAIGNIVSDVAGIMLGTLIEDYCAGLGLPVPQITAAQRQLRSVRFANQLGCGIGIVIGCIIGMFPLLFIDSDKANKMKQEARMDSLFQDVITKAKDLIGAELTNLYIIVDSKDSTTPTAPSESHSQDYFDGKYFYCKYGRAFHIPVQRSIISRTAMTGEVSNVGDVSQDPDFSKNFWKEAFPGMEIRSMVCVPVFDSQGRVLAILQGVNKQSRGYLARRDSHYVVGKKASGFSRTDVSVLTVLASHIGVSLQNMYSEDVELELKDTIKILEEHGLAGLPVRG